jgi:mannose-6-phosphate isomerase-like protein (cupin superfamily)
MNVSEVDLGEQVHVIVLQQAVRNANTAVGLRLKTCDHSPDPPLAAASRAEVIVPDTSNKRMAFEERNVKTTMLPEESDAKSPAGADIRFLMDGKTGDMIHSTVPPHQINKATVHATVSEFWYVLEGHGEIWRDDGKESNITVLVPGTSIDIPVGTAFQYRNVSNVELKFICITMPPWPGESEATYVKGIWQPTI